MTIEKFPFRRSVMRTWLLLVLLLALVCSVSAQQPRASVSVVSSAPTRPPAPSPADAAKMAEVIKFEKDMEAAVVRGDVAYLDRVLSSDFLFTHGDGWTTGGEPLKVDTKETWLAYVKQQPPPYLYRNLDAVQVELHGDVAITYGRYLYKPRSNSPNPSPGHLYVWFERVYVKHNGQWQHVSQRTVRGPLREDDAPTSASAK